MDNKPSFGWLKTSPSSVKWALLIHNQATVHNENYITNNKTHLLTLYSMTLLLYKFLSPYLAGLRKNPNKRVNQSTPNQCNSADSAY